MWRILSFVKHRAPPPPFFLLRRDDGKRQKPKTNRRRIASASFCSLSFLLLPHNLQTKPLELYPVISITMSKSLIPFQAQASCTNTRPTTMIANGQSSSSRRSRTEHADDQQPRSAKRDILLSVIDGVLDLLDEDDDCCFSSSSQN